MHLALAIGTSGFACARWHRRGYRHPGARRACLPVASRAGNHLPPHPWLNGPSAGSWARELLAYRSRSRSMRATTPLQAARPDGMANANKEPALSRWQAAAQAGRGLPPRANSCGPLDAGRSRVAASPSSKAKFKADADHPRPPISVRGMGLSSQPPPVRIDDLRRHIVLAVAMARPRPSHTRQLDPRLATPAGRTTCLNRTGTLYYTDRPSIRPIV